MPTEGGPVWTFRGYRISAGEFNTAMVHFYRGEMARSNTWRSRLDSTTNWAVITSAAALTFMFGQPSNPHLVGLIMMVLVAAFLFIEARRYRYYELWAYRVRLMETDFFAAMLVPPFSPSEEWATSLAESLLHPDFPISIWEALGRRLRRNYAWIFLLLSLSWFVKVAMHPTVAENWGEFLARASIGFLPGSVVVAGMIAFDVALVLLGLLTVGLQRATGEVLPHGAILPDLGALLRALAEVPSEVLPRTEIHLRWPRRRRERMATIITTKGDVIAQRIMREVQHGVTALKGVGMYTGQPRDVLLTAIHPREVHQLLSIVRSEDPEAFMVVNPAQEVRGKGFEPLEE
jgi:uncharacterized membrane protein